MLRANGFLLIFHNVTTTISKRAYSKSKVMADGQISVVIVTQSAPHINLCTLCVCSDAIRHAMTFIMENERKEFCVAFHLSFSHVICVSIGALCTVYVLQCKMYGNVPKDISHRWCGVMGSLVDFYLLELCALYIRSIVLCFGGWRWWQWRNRCEVFVVLHY